MLRSHFVLIHSCRQHFTNQSQSVPFITDQTVDNIVSDLLATSVFSECLGNLGDVNCRIAICFVFLFVLHELL